MLPKLKNNPKADAKVKQKTTTHKKTQRKYFITIYVFIIIYNIRPKEQHTPYIYYTTKRRTWKINQRRFSNQQTTQAMKVDNQSSNFHPEKNTAKIFNHQPKHLLSHRSTPSSQLLKTSFSTPQNLNKNTLHNPLIINTLQNTLPSLSFCTPKDKKTKGKR